jgi:dTMP kinase
VLEELVQRDLHPDLTLLLDAPLDLTSARAQRRNSDAGMVDRFELEQRAFFERVRDAYLARARAFPERIAVIDASGSMESVTTALRTTIEQRLMNHG